jgi:hypothetical protein
MTLTEIERALRELRLSGIAATLNTRIMQAQSSQEPFLDTFASAAGRTRSAPLAFDRAPIQTIRPRRTAEPG